ncbi:unnamed protein product [Dimorphilus gyrociliatus]|uniref:Serpin domain-containing protein n=1 Tax=Dimorphilus gyrociliatus TaxID=2664684 RepID=A0A7I8WEY4_9ANNE|nr:unnamed protein product [Dimorphilus gyrociliatus]
MISKRVKKEDITNYLSLHTHSNDTEKVGTIIKSVDDYVRQLTNGMIGYRLEESGILQPGARIYLSILYFKGTWQYGLTPMKERMEFTNIEGKKIFRDYVYSSMIYIKVSRYMIDPEKLIYVFILPLNDDTKRRHLNRFEAIYIAPTFLVSNAEEWKEVYTKFIENCTYGEEGNFRMKHDAFENNMIKLIFPKFDQVCEDIDLNKMFPETYQGGPNPDFAKFVMKVRVKIDENGIEGAAAAEVTYNCGEVYPEKLVVDKPYIVLIYDRELRQTLFTVKDNGLNVKN